MVGIKSWNAASNLESKVLSSTILPPFATNLIPPAQDREASPPFLGGGAKNFFFMN